MNNINYELNSILSKLEIYNKYEHTLLQLRDNEVHLLYDYIKTQDEKIRQLIDLVKMLDKSKDIVNITKELEEI